MLRFCDSGSVVDYLLHIRSQSIHGKQRSELFCLPPHKNCNAIAFRRPMFALMDGVCGKSCELLLTIALSALCIE